MLKNYFKTGIRNLMRNRANTLINIWGLAIGIACCLLMVMYVKDEMRYDQFHENGDRIYRLWNRLKLAGTDDNIARTGFAVSTQMQQDYPEIEAVVRFVSAGDEVTVTYEDKVFNEELFYFTDSTVFDVFSFEMIKGNPQKALIHPRTTVLTESIAKKYFGDADPIGKSIRFNTSDYEITGIIKDIPSHTDFPIRGLISLSTVPPPTRQVWSQDWGRLVNFSYLMFKQPIQPESFQAKLDQFSETYVIPFWKENSVDGEIRYGLDALSSLHFRTGLSYDTPKGNLTYLYIFSMVALIMLMIACINYINLSIAQSTKRSTEVGIRKAAGAHRPDLIKQFMGESLLLAFGALAVSIVLVELALPFFNQLAGKDFGFYDLFEWDLLLTMIALGLLVGIVAGSYPALYMASFKPVQVLKGGVSLSGRSRIRKLLVVFQFSISIILIISTMTVYRQMDYLKNQDLGFYKDQVMAIQVPNDTSIRRRIPNIKGELLAHTAVEKVAGSSRGAVPGAQRGTLLMRLEREQRLEEKSVNTMFIDENYLDLLQIELLQGRNFDRNRQSDPMRRFIVNESLLRMQNWEEALKKRVQWGLMANDSAVYDGEVIGVVKDFHYASLHNEVDPLVLIYSPQNPALLWVHISGNKLQEGISFVEDKWRSLVPGHPMEYFFLDTLFNEQYNRESQMMRIFGYFTLLTILIACMGLFGLSAFITQQRTKEIGIRKTLGAEVKHILLLLSKDFAFLVMIAMIVAAPIAWYAMHQWLQGFAYQAGISPVLMIVAGMLALLIAQLTVSFHAWKAAKSDPVDALRYE